MNFTIFMQFDNKKLVAKISRGFFITGTDTNVGKTTFAVQLLKLLAQHNFTTCALKPIASGYEDALLLQKYATLKLEYAQVNPFSFELAIAPHIAAAEVNLELSVADILAHSKFALTSNVDYIVIEGAGGWSVPLNNKETMADLALAYGYPVIVVVNLRLGCINHALLTLQAIKKYRLDILGWVANITDDKMQFITANILTILEHTKVPLLGIMLPTKMFIQNTEHKFFLDLQNCRSC